MASVSERPGVGQFSAMLVLCVLLFCKYENIKRCHSRLHSIPPSHDSTISLSSHPATYATIVKGTKEIKTHLSVDFV